LFATINDPTSTLAATGFTITVDGQPTTFPKAKPFTKSLTTKSNFDWGEHAGLTKPKASGEAKSQGLRLDKSAQHPFPISSFDDKQHTIIETPKG